MAEKRLMDSFLVLINLRALFVDAFNSCKAIN